MYPHRRRRDADSSNKVAFVAAVEMREGRPRRVRCDPLAGFSFAALTPWAKLAVAPGSCMVSDGLLGFEVLKQIIHGFERYRCCERQ